MDLLIKNGTVITVNQTRDVVKADVAIGQGRIVKVGDCTGIAADKVIDATGCAVMPGMINTHTHIYQALIEGGMDAEMICIDGAPHEGSFWSSRLHEEILDFIGRRL